MILSVLKSSSDDELKSLREKNREYESSQERLSSEKVSKQYQPKYK